MLVLLRIVLADFGMQAFRDNLYLSTHFGVSGISSGTSEFKLRQFCQGIFKTLTFVSAKSS